MAAPDFSAAAALAHKAVELRCVGHFARAAAKFGQALDAASAQRCPDCLVVARLQVDHTMNAVNALRMEVFSDAECKARLAALVAQVVATAATLQRRKAAGTLLGATCTAAELRWFEHVLEDTADALKDPTMRRDARQLAQTFGYSTLLWCAIELIGYVLLSSTTLELLVMAAEQQRECWTFLADTVECMAQPRACEHMSLSAEGAFVEEFRKMLSNPRCSLPRDEVGARLRDAWQRLESSGVLQRRNIELGLQLSAETESVVRNAAAAAAADPGLRRCGLASCGVREAHPAHFKSCAACRGVAYCSKEHQTEDWPSHKAACKAARKAAAEHESSSRAREQQRAS